MAAADGGKRARPTIYDVARRAGVSKSLVSLVLQGSPQVRENRRAAVLAAIAELDYRPSRAATVLASHRTKTIEVVIDDYRNLWFVGLIRGMQSELSGRGYYLTVTDIQLNATVGGGLGGLSTYVDGLVIAAEPQETTLQGWTGPTVVAGRRDSVPTGLDLIANDDDLGGQIAAEHLLSLGHRRIGHLTGSGGPARHRRAGFTKAMRKARLQPRVTGQHHGTSENDGYVAATELFDRFPDTTAIFAANDTMALGALAAIRERGHSVPEDVSLIGYDNSPLAQSRYLNLTSVDDQSEVVGAATARTLLARIDNPTTRPTATLIKPTLIRRGTTSASRPTLTRRTSESDAQARPSTDLRAGKAHEH
jgi:DNA-binding LacI/PurR family transcriptional regulator